MPCICINWCIGPAVGKVDGHRGYIVPFLSILFNAEGFARNDHSVQLDVAVTQSCCYNR